MIFKWISQSKLHWNFGFPKDNEMKDMFQRNIQNEYTKNIYYCSRVHKWVCTQKSILL